MIKICYPPGCYGSYLSRCVYNYSDLRTQALDPFEFDNVGSSHQHRDQTKNSDIIQIDHLGNRTTFDDSECTLIILPCHNHRLDYFNNMLIKANDGQVVNYLKNIFGQSDIEIKLKQGWDHAQDPIPTWILREFISFWINDCFNNGYSVEKYQAVPHKVCITTQDIFLDFQNTMGKIFKVFGLQPTVSESVMWQNHQRFLQAQKYHRSQLRCHQWCDDILNKTDSPTPCDTIFDEAYVQHVLREQGFEMQCHGLDEFPKTSIDLAEIIYKL